MGGVGLTQRYDYFMKIDIHVHTKERSACGRSTTDEQIRAAIDAGLDAIAFTDHGRLTPAEEIARLNTEYAPFRVVQGIEISVDGEDAIVLGIGDPAISTEKRDYPHLHAFVRERGGFLAIVHPFRCHPAINIPIRKFPPHAIEICSNNTPCHAAEQIAGLAQSLDISVLSNSDAHTAEALGRHYNLIDGRPRNETEIIDALKRGEFTAIAIEPDGKTKELMRLGKPRA